MSQIFDFRDDFNTYRNILSEFSKPNETSFAGVVNLSHKAYLLVPFVNIILINAESINFGERNQQATTPAGPRAGPL